LHDIFAIYALINKHPHLATTPNNNGEILTDLATVKAIEKNKYRHNKKELTTLAQLLSNPFTIPQYLAECVYEQ